MFFSSPTTFYSFLNLHELLLPLLTLMVSLFYSHDMVWRMSGAKWTQTQKELRTEKILSFRKSRQGKALCTSMAIKQDTCGGTFCVAMQEESPTQRRHGRAGALMSNTDGFIWSFGRRIHKTSPRARGSDFTVELPRQFWRTLPQIHAFS